MARRSFRGRRGRSGGGRSRGAGRRGSMRRGGRGGAQTVRLVIQQGPPAPPQFGGVVVGDNALAAMTPRVAKARATF